MEPDKNLYKAYNDIYINITYENKSGKTIYKANTNLPVEGLQAEDLASVQSMRNNVEHSCYQRAWSRWQP